MSRLAISSGGTLTLNVLPDWVINVTTADLAGNVTVVLPGGDPNALNRPFKVHVVYSKGSTPTDPVALLASGPNASVAVPGPGILNADISLSLQVPLPLPTGTVLVMAVGEYTV